MSVDWNAATTEGHVSIGTHSLFLRAAGTRIPGTPAVIGITGLGDSSVSWKALMRHLAVFCRIYTYDRTGLGESELPDTFTPDAKAYVNIAKELRLLLSAAVIQPPYLLVMHSMGGLPGREFLHLYPSDVAGMVFVDTITENNYKTRPKELPRTMRAMCDGLDMSFAWTERKPAMTDDELRETLAAAGTKGDHRTEDVKTREDTAAMAEVQNLIPSSDALAEKAQFDTVPLGDKPVSVIKGDAPGEFRKSIDIAIAAGRGTANERTMMDEYLATADGVMLSLQFKQLRLSRNSRLVEARHSWHNVHWYEPALIAREVKWCLNEIAETKIA